MTLYLDCAAHMPMNEAALKAFVDYNNSTAGHGNALAPSTPGRSAAIAIENAREKIASLLGAKSASQIVFTSTATQACEWAVSTLKQLDCGVICISPTEHPAVRQAANKYFPETTEIKIDKNGVIQKTKFNYYESVICTHVQNEIGIIQPIDNIKCRYLFSDMSQSCGKITINLSNLSIDLATFSAHTFGGPASIGLIYLKDTNYWKEFGTGSRYYLDRPGTMDVASIVATAAALELAVNTLPERTQKMQEFKTILENGLEEMDFKIIAKDAARSPSTTFVRLGPEKGFTTMMALDEKGIYVSLGSACGAAHTGKSPLMAKLGINGGAHDFIRISQFGQYGENEAKLFINTLKDIYA